MALLSYRNLSLHLGGKKLFTDLDISIDTGDRIGVVGPNGCGKSSLLKLLGGRLEADGGILQSGKDLRIGYLPQEIEVAPHLSVAEFTLSGIAQKGTLNTQITELEQKCAAGGDDDELVALSSELAELYETLANIDLLYPEHLAMQILSGLGFAATDMDRPLSHFSGGWQMRAYLGRLLFMRPDLLLLDEPTNHLDMPAVAWLGNFLQRFPSAVLLICHDRDFLNDQSKRIWSFEVEGVRSYRGNYDQYQRQREEESVQLEQRQKNLARERQHAQDFIDRFRSQANKAKAVQSRIKALAKMDVVESLETAKRMSIEFPKIERFSKQALRLEGLTKSFDDNVLFAGVDLNVSHGDRIAVVGPNGAGKTTLLKIIASQIEATSGTVALGKHTDIGYYAQHHWENLSPEQTVLQAVAEVAKDQGIRRIRGLLGAMLFHGDDVDKKIDVLSGGERARVALARLLSANHNLLVLDEPTNHLDLWSSEQLAEALSEYQGTLIFVSHNRHFVRHLARLIWTVNEGDLSEYTGNLNDYMRATIAAQKNTESATHRETIKKQAGGPVNTSDSLLQSVGNGDFPEYKKEHKKENHKGNKKERKRREAELRARRRNVLEPLQREVAKSEASIAELEKLQSDREALMVDATFMQSLDSAGVLQEYKEDGVLLARLHRQWERSAAQLEKIQVEF